ncbi:hypothetical protein DdX_01105 [Ditylenchus destructor]|uniref:Uncharacterized protein n=1 Tax=Ditylenchus destructor TaxID=166010 RepID=A0AAD4NIM3_9BILA|nr:hypothetical protein DdX_01105 [Ditylenchus destructor]
MKLERNSIGLPPRLRRLAAPLVIQDFPEAINLGTRKSCRRDRYQSTPLAETKRLTIFRISGSHKSRYSQILSARPVPFVLSRREEAIDVSHARIRAPIGKLPFYVTHVTHG